MEPSDPYAGDLAGRAVVPGHRVRLTAESARVGPPGPPSDPGPRVEVLREGNEVRAIDVTCPCGQRVRLQCVYES